MVGSAVGIDIGGTKLTAAVVGADGTIGRRARRRTPTHDPDAITAVVADLVAEVGGGGLPAGIGAAGLIDAQGRVRYAPNIDWVDYPLGALLAERLDVAVTVDNDATAAAWGEYRCGAGRAARDSMVMLTVGTGVGGGVVTGGTILRGARGLAGELGHLIVHEGGAVCPCGNRGCLEAYASGTAIGRLAREALAAGEVGDGSALHGSAELSGKVVTAAAQVGDAAAVAILARAGRWLGIGVASIVNALDPELVVVGGGALQAGELLLGPARTAAAARVIGRSHRAPTPIVAAELADDAGMVGAALLALGG